MIRKLKDLRFSVKQNAKGGHGDFINHHILEKDEFYDKGRYYALCRLAPGDSVGLHTHMGEMEICHFISGTGTILSAGKKHLVSPGDTNIVLDGEEHAVLNTGTEELVYTALILYRY